MIKLRSLTASAGLNTVSIIYLSSPEKAPCARTMVALRCSFSLMKSQIGFGLEQTTLKYFERFKLSIKLSMRVDLIISPRKENNPVLIEYKETGKCDKKVRNQ